MPYDELIQIPEYLSDNPDGEISLAASSCAAFCEIACETEAMLCGECSGQSCSGQCAASECSQSCREACKAGLSCSECYSSAQCSQSCSESFVPVRPSDWMWTSTIVSGREIRITASEWNGFCSRINEFRAYKSLSNYSFTTVVSGTTKISAAIVNQARTAISAISGHGSLPSAAIAGGALTASFFNSLSSALNAVA